uniref:MYND-type domain-containing protein n=1 Tax=Homalodisca liturata TaxID=320908 RepID=A0A1B6IF70_9HEMI
MGEHILEYPEIEIYTSSLSPSKLDELGLLSWFECHKRLHMLYQEALLEIINGDNETVKEAFLVHGKVKVLVLEAITLSVWRQNIFPCLCNIQISKEKVFAVFTVLYHEVTAFGLLESLAFYSDCVESLHDTAVELLDYCVASILQIINRDVPKVLHEKLDELTAQEELQHHESNIVHNLAVKSISVIRYLAEAFEHLPLNITSRFYNNHDVPMLLCKVIEMAPWCTTGTDGKQYHFVDGNWRKRQSTDEAINKSEGQAWLSLRQVLLDQRLLQYYEFNDYRRQQLCKLIRHLHDDMLDQLSPLAELKHFLCQLSVANLPTPQARPLILELVAEYRDKLLRKFANKWEKLTMKQADMLRDLDINQIRSIAKGLSETYRTLDLVEPESAKCGNCGEPAASRCSRCKSEWYCGRECQVKMWNKHKSICALISDQSVSQ